MQLGGWLQTPPKYQVPQALAAIHEQIQAGAEAQAARAAASQQRRLEELQAEARRGGGGDVAPGRHGQRWRPGGDGPGGSGAGGGGGSGMGGGMGGGVGMVA